MKIFCSGIGGIGLSAYAAYQRDAGHTVSGSDRTESALLADLRAQEIAVALTQDGSAVPHDADLFVYTLALPEDHPELLRAKQLGIPQKTYFEALGDLTRSSRKQLIAVCGTHGKSSTTAMAAKVLIDAGADPSVVLGTKTSDLGGSTLRQSSRSGPAIRHRGASGPEREGSSGPRTAGQAGLTTGGRNWRRGEGEFFLVEACEYHRSFLHLSPKMILLTNADGDHFDAFADLREYQNAFQEFIAKLPSDGVLITYCSDSGLQTIVQFAKERNLRVIDADAFIPPKLKVPGQHMRENAQLVLALAAELGLDRTKAETSLGAYTGSWRRMEVRGETPQGILVIDDYGHHPAEITATLQAICEGYPGRRIVCVFQPHTHDRTLKLYNSFTSAFRNADVVVIPNVYDARPQAESEKVDVATFVRDIAEASDVKAFHGQSLEQTMAMLQEDILQPSDLLITMGAGDVWKVADALLA